MKTIFAHYRTETLVSFECFWFCLIWNFPREFGPIYPGLQLSKFWILEDVWDSRGVLRKSSELPSAIVPEGSLRPLSRICFPLKNRLRKTRTSPKYWWRPPLQIWTLRRNLSLLWSKFIESSTKFCRIYYIIKYHIMIF